MVDPRRSRGATGGNTAQEAGTANQPLAVDLTANTGTKRRYTRVGNVDVGVRTACVCVITHVPCRCGSTSHQRTNHKLCPTNVTHRENNDCALSALIRLRIVRTSACDPQRLSAKHGTGVGSSSRRHGRCAFRSLPSPTCDSCLETCRPHSPS